MIYTDLYIRNEKKFLEYIKIASESTYNQNVIKNNGFAGLFNLVTSYKNPVLVSSCDGVGSKIELAQYANKFDSIGIDLVAMCINDLICSGARPLFFLDYISLGHIIDYNCETIISGIVKGCQEAECVLIAGETAQLGNGERYDLCGFAVGVVEKDSIIDGSKILEDDIVIGIESNGFHCSGYTEITRAFKNKISLEIFSYYLNNSIIDELLKPTIIYHKLISELVNKFENNIHGIAHITGGGLKNKLPRLLSNNLSIVLVKDSFPKLPIFDMVKILGNLGENNFENIFNCGIGMCLVIPKEIEGQIHRTSVSLGYKSRYIGKVIKRKDNDPVFTVNRDSFLDL